MGVTITVLLSQLISLTVTSFEVSKGYYILVKGSITLQLKKTQHKLGIEPFTYYKFIILVCVKFVSNLRKTMLTYFIDVIVVDKVSIVLFETTNYFSLVTFLHNP